MRSPKFLLQFISLLLFSIGLQADPGGWISSGGEIFKNGKNPWFVKNTTDVAYCVEFSSEEFSISREDALGLIENGFSYWKNQLDGHSAIDLGRPDGTGLREENVQVATQKFKLNTTCSGSEDLVFKFGYKSLEKDEIDHMKTPENYVGLTIRKKYDDVKLKGSGSIYISADRGPHSYKKTSKDVIDEAWKYPKLLQYVIIHELGHVFGLPHSGSGLMSEVFLDQLLIQKFAALYVREPISSFIKPADSAEICDGSVLPMGTQSFLASYFSLVYKEDCLKLEITANRREFSILTKKLAATTWSKIGSLFIDKNELIDYSLKPALVLQLTETQTPFGKTDATFLIGPLFQNYKVDGHINFGTSLKPLSVQVDLSPDAIVVYGLSENKVRQIFSFGNPLLFSLSKPF